MKIIVSRHEPVCRLGRLAARRRCESTVGCELRAVSRQGRARRHQNGKALNAKDLTDPKVQAAFTDAKATQSIKEGVKENGKTTMKAFAGKLTTTKSRRLLPTCGR